MADREARQKESEGHNEDLIKYPYRERDRCQMLYLSLLHALDDIDDPVQQFFKADSIGVYFRKLEKTKKCDSFHNYSMLRTSIQFPNKFLFSPTIRTYHRDFVKESLNLKSVLSYYLNPLGNHTAYYS